MTLKNRNKRFRIDTKKLMVALIVIFIFGPSLVSTITLEPSHNSAWLMRHGFENDYDVLNWIHENVQPDELILNDYSHVSHYLLSFSVKNVTSKYVFNTDQELTRAKEVQDFWKTPNDILKLSNLISNYNVSYLLVTSERAYLNWVKLDGDNQYLSKPFTPAAYRSFFDDNPLLELSFEKGNAAVYKVLDQQIELTSSTALEFDGLDDYLEVAHSESLNLETFSIAFWMMPSDLPLKDSFIVSKSDLTTGLDIAWRWNKRIAIYFSNKIVLQSNKTFDETDLGKWWHIVATYDGTNASIYINGKLDSTTEYVVETILNSAPLYINCRFSSAPFGFPSSVVMDDFLIFDNALLMSEVEQLYNGNLIADNLVLDLPFYENQGTIAYDQSNNSNNAAVYGATWITYYLPVFESVPYRK